MPQLKAKATISTGDTSEGVPGPLQLQLDEGVRAMTKHNHDLGNLVLSAGGDSGQVEQVLEEQVAGELPTQKDLIEFGAEDNTINVGFRTFYRRTKSGATKVFTASANIPGSGSSLTTGSAAVSPSLS